MKKSKAKPCKECPYVLGRTQGYIGAYESGNDLHRIATQDGLFPCHLTMSTPKETNCRGIALYRRAIAKRQFDPAIQALEDAVVDHNQSETCVPPFQLGVYHGR